MIAKFIATEEVATRKTKSWKNEKPPELSAVFTSVIFFLPDIIGCKVSKREYRCHEKVKRGLLRTMAEVCDPSPRPSVSRAGDSCPVTTVLQWGKTAGQQNGGSPVLTATT